MCQDHSQDNIINLSWPWLIWHGMTRKITLKLVIRYQQIHHYCPDKAFCSVMCCSVTLSFIYRLCITFPTVSTPGLDTPVELKLKLIPMLQHMHHDASLASSSRELLQHLVNSYPSTPMVIVTLHTFTQLAASSLIDIPKQVQYALTELHLRAIHTMLTHVDCVASQPPHDELQRLKRHPGNTRRKS